ncbi:helix-turn-helix domain-containing protein [Anaerolineae bacterium CFX9]|jgi:excisionase family DNA binding protein|nr:helix-turn-helix domain-containing protein [Anaerolineae bacterium CFX9]
MDIITFVLGIFVLMRGSFRIAGRHIPQLKARRIGLLLMTPLALEFCYAPFLLSNVVTVNEEGVAVLNQAAFDSALNTLVGIQLVVLALVLGSIIYIIYSVPPGVSVLEQTPQQTPPRFAGQPVPAAPAPPSIMTVEEAAAYMRVPEAEVIALIEAGKIGAVRSGGSYRIARIAIDDYVSGGQGE